MVKKITSMITSAVLYNILLYISILLCIPSTASAYSAIEVMAAVAGSSATPATTPVTTPAPTPAPTTPPPSAPSTCGRDSLLPVKSCDIGAGFVCINTPALSVVEDYIMLHGTTDVKNSTLSSLAASVQNEYTNEYNQINFDKPTETSDCWSKTADYCLDSNGYFSIKIPLGQKMGPYSIAVTATRPTGAPAKETLRVSRVTAPKPTDADVKLEQKDSSALVTVDLLHSCQFCDFLGIATGGLELTVTNIISTSDGGTKQVKVKTNTAAGGIFSVCLPTENGTNNVTVNVCNAATGFDPLKCPTLTLKPFTATGDTGGINWTTPVQPIYSADYNPTVSLTFTLPSANKASCDENNVKFTFNRDAEQKICADASGKYTLNLDPQAGINVGIVSHEGEDYPFTFGWGEIVSPFEKNGSVKKIDSLWIDAAGGFAIDKRFLSDTVKLVLNNFLKSDGFKGLLAKVPQMLGKSGAPSSDTSSATSEMDAIKNEIPQCSAGNSGGNHLGFKITRAPEMEKADVPQLEFKQDAISLTLDLVNAKAWAEVFLDNDYDGKPDKRVMPLRFGFRKLFAPIMVKVDRSGDKPRLLLTADTTDCEYKSKQACTGKPAIIVPKVFVGNALDGGAFVACDSSVESDCVGVNLLNGQTGLVSMTVLDTINDLLYCDGSAFLTYMLREVAKNVPIKIGCAATDYAKAPLTTIGCTSGGLLSDRGWMLPLGLDLLNKQFNVSESGIWGTVPAIAGDPTFYSSLSSTLKKPETGFIRRPLISSGTTIASPNSLSGYDFGIAVGEDLINALFFLLSEQDPVKMTSGVFDWDLSEAFLKKIGFDEVKSCDEFKAKSMDDKPSTLCQLRPRVGEILGSALTSNGYFQQKQPIMLRLRGNRGLTPHVSFFKKNEKQYIDLQLGDLDISFYALQTDADKQADQYGNLPLKLDANGNPIIQSMNSNDPNPDNGQIIKMKLTLLLALEISKIATDPADPSKLALTIRPDADLTKIIFRSIPGGNTTTIPDDSLISAFKEKIKYGINIYSAPENAIKLALPKDYAFANDPNGTDIASLLGISNLSLGKDGLQIGVEDSQEYIDILAKFILTQVLKINGTSESFTIPN